MPYSRAWDETTPAGSSNANALDTAIQNFKADVRERIAQVVPGWSNELEDPKRVVIHIGTSRPASPHTGELFFDTDDIKLEIWDGTEWVTLTTAQGSIVLVDTLANRPAANTVNNGTLFWATDEDILYIDEADTWVAINTKTEYEVYLQEHLAQSIPATSTVNFTLTVPTATTEADPDNALLIQARVRWKESGAYLEWVTLPTDSYDPGHNLAITAGNVLSNIGTDHWKISVSLFNNLGTAETTDIQIELVLRNIGPDVLTVS